MMDIYLEIEHSTATQHTSDLLDDAPWISSMIHHIVAQHYVKRAIAERQALTLGRNGTSPALPGGKQLRIMVRKRIQAEPILRPEEEDQTVSAAANLEYPSISRDRTHMVQHTTHLSRTSDHPRDNCLLGPLKLSSLSPLVFKLSIQRPSCSDLHAAIPQPHEVSSRVSRPNRPRRA